LAGATLFTVAAAFANSVDDGNAGLDALNKNDFATAIKMFTRAIKSGQLAGSDKEFAYLNRGKAYLGNHQVDLAIADLKAAARLVPGDGDVATALAEAQSQKADAAAPVAAPRKSAGWGAIASLAGRYFWYQQPGKTAHQAVVHYEWGTPQQVLYFTLHDKDGIIASGEYKLDTVAGAIVWVQVADSGAQDWGTIQSTADGATASYFQNGVAQRTMMAFSEGGVTENTQNYLNGNWQDANTVNLVSADEADVRSAGFLREGH
jgi:tetratricopeptide (TPR) repeat protein